MVGTNYVYKDIETIVQMVSKLGFDIQKIKDILSIATDESPLANFCVFRDCLPIDQLVDHRFDATLIKNLE